MAKPIKTIIKELEAHKVNLGKQRDELRDLESEVSELLGACEQAYDYLSDAVDSLSELV